jgi:retinol-binding protein 3
MLYPALTAADTPTVPLDWDATMRAQTLTSAEKALDDYFFIDRIAKIRDAIEANRSMLMSIVDPNTFATALTKVLYTASRDEHLAVSYSPDVLPPPQEGRPSPAAIASMERMNAMQDYGYSSSAHLPGNIGFLRLMSFGPLSDTKAIYDAAMTLLSNTDALVIDLRGNYGGAAATVDYLLGYFFPSPVQVTGILMRSGTTITDHKMYTPATLGAPRYLDKPVYVLINQYTFSGGEQFAYDLRTLHRAQLVGSTTAGGANPGGDVRLNAHFSIFIPTGTARNPYTGTNWDGVGVTPDVVVDPDSALVEAYRLALESAKNPFPPAVADREFALKDPGRALQVVLPHQ